MKVSDIPTSNTIESRIISLQNDLSRSKMQQKRYELELRSLVSMRSKISQSVEELSTSYQREVKQMQQKIKKLEEQNRKLVKSNNLYKMSIENFEKTILEKDKIISTILGKQFTTTTAMHAPSNRVQQMNEIKGEQVIFSKSDEAINKSSRSIQRSNGRIKVYSEQKENEDLFAKQSQEQQQNAVVTISNPFESQDIVETLNPIIDSQRQQQPIVIQQKSLAPQQVYQQTTSEKQIDYPLQQQYQSQPQPQPISKQKQLLFQTASPQQYTEETHNTQNSNFIESFLFQNNSLPNQLDSKNTFFNPFFQKIQSQDKSSNQIHSTPVENELIKTEVQQVQIEYLHNQSNEVQESVIQPPQIKKVIPPPPKGKRVAPPPPSKKVPSPPQQQKIEPAQEKKTPAVQEAPQMVQIKKPPPPPASISGGIKPKAVRQKHIQRYKPVVQFQDEQVYQPQPTVDNSLSQSQHDNKFQTQQSHHQHQSIQLGNQQNDTAENNVINQSKDILQVQNDQHYSNEEQFPSQTIQHHEQQRISFDDNVTHNYFPTQQRHDDNKVQIHNVSHGSINKSKRGKRHLGNQAYNIINFDDNDSMQQPAYDMFSSQRQENMKSKSNNYGLSKTEFSPKKSSKRVSPVETPYQFNFKPEYTQQDHEMHGMVDESSIQQIDDLSMISGSIFPEQHEHFESDRFLHSQKKRKGSQHDRREESNPIVEVAPSKKMSKKKGKRDNVQSISPISFV